MVERRRHRRVRFPRPLRAACGEVRIYLVDVSDSGMLVVHADELAHGRFCHVQIASEIGPIRLDCQIVRTSPHEVPRSSRPLYESALTILSADHQSRQRMHSFVAAADIGLSAGVVT